MDHHALVMHLGYKDLIAAQIASRNRKTILIVKTQYGTDRLADNLTNDGVPVGASERLKIVRSPVRSRPKPRK